MKKFVFILLAATMLLAGTSVMAQDAKGFKFGIGLEGALPLSGLKTSYDFGAGLTLRGSLGVAEIKVAALNLRCAKLRGFRLQRSHRGLDVAGLSGAKGRY